MLKQTIKESPHRSFKVSRVANSIAICEAVKGDKYNWGNSTETEPAFIAYLGCQKDEVARYVKTFNTFYRCEFCEVRKPKYLKGFEIEIKIRGIQRYSDSHAMGLDYLIESQEWRDLECNSDEYEYYTTGHYSS